MPNADFRMPNVLELAIFLTHVILSRAKDLFKHASVLKPKSSANAVPNADFRVSNVLGDIPRICHSEPCEESLEG